MNFTKEQLECIEEMAGLFYNPEDIAINIEMDSEDFCNQVKAKTGEGFKAYMRGWIKKDIALRQAISKAAENGSSPAQQLMIDYQNKNRVL